LGSNERDFGWMDEGLNTLNEMRFVAEKYPDNTRLSDMVGGAAKKLGFVGLSHKDEGDVLYRCMSSFGVDQPIHSHSADFSQTNYGGVMYQKTGLVFHYLKAYLGDSLFDLCMHTYFDRWKFRHPQPEDFRVVMEAVSKQDLGWLFDDLIDSRKVADFKLVGVKKSGAGMDVKVRNVGWDGCESEKCGFSQWPHWRSIHSQWQSVGVGLDVAGRIEKSGRCGKTFIP